MDMTPMEPDSQLGAGPTSNKQSRKLQLRKAGFKAKDVPQRNITPHRSASWSRNNAPASLTPRHATLETDRPELPPPNPVLREVSNSSRRRRKHSRPRIDESVFVIHDENIAPSPKAVATEISSRHEDSAKRYHQIETHPGITSDMTSATPSSNQKPKSPSKGIPAARLRKQSVSIDAGKYIEHLEAELAAAQTQLTAMTSPTVLQARSMKMRTLNAETRQLHDQVTEWEQKFHQRVQEEIEERSKIEQGLKSRIRLLEGDVEDYAQRAKDMQQQLEKTTSTATAAEAANMELERRIDAISGLVASPKKTELERAELLAMKRHSRQKSVLPRFPTTGTLQLPFKTADTPITPSNRHSTALCRSISADDVDYAPRNLNVNGNALAALTGGIIDTRPVSPLEPPTGVDSSKRFSWATPECYTTLDSVAASTGRPSRRMRRFHAGTLMPKPLLLPSTATSTSYQIPASAPPMEKSETPPSFPFPELSHLAGFPDTRNFDFLLSPQPGNGRRRALTCIEDVAAAMRRSSNPFVSPIPFPAAMAKSSNSSGITERKVSDKSLHAISSLSLDPSPFGRNLFDELKRVSSGDVDDISDDRTLYRSGSNSTNATQRPSKLGSIRFSSNVRGHGVRRARMVSHQRTLSDQTGISAYHAALLNSDISSSDIEAEDDDHAVSSSSDDYDIDLDQVAQSNSAAAAVFTSMWRQGFNTARNCLDYAQATTIGHHSVRRLQWWLVQIVVGPLTTHMMMAEAARDARRRARAAGRHRPSSAARPSTSTHPRTARTGGHHRAQQRASKSTSTALTRRSELTGVRVVDGGIVWIQRHTPWMWLRFSIALLFAIGAALRDGPGVVLGLEEGGGVDGLDGPHGYGLSRRDTAQLVEDEVDA